MDQNATDRAEAFSENPEEEGLHYLWHLNAINLMSSGGEFLEGRFPEPGTPPEDSVESTVKVAIIDNGACKEHPNLLGSRMTKRADFSSWASPTSYSGNGCNTRDEEVRFLLALSKLYGLDAGDEEQVARRHLLTQGVPVPDPKLDPEGSAARFSAVDPDFRFAAHGTACAGLVGANANFAGIAPPAEDDERKEFAAYDERTASAEDDECTKLTGDDKCARKPNPNAIRYTGIDPYAEIIPINTVYSHEYWPLTSALLYAQLHEADVILFPRSVEDMAECGAEADDPRLTRFRDDLTRRRHKEVFEALLRDVSQKIPVVVAAGNSGPGPLEYPARLSLNSNGAPDLIVVGAVTAFGQRATYCAGNRWLSEHAVEDDVFIYAPSDDREEISDDYVRYDDLSWRGSKIGPPEGYGNERFCPYKILAIDIPGPYGYATDPNEARDLNDPGIDPDAKKQQYQPQNRPGSLYSLFGGTSAASSIVAGVVSQMHRAAGERLSSSKVRHLLQQSWTIPKVYPDPRAPAVPSNDPASITNTIDAKKAIEAARAKM